MICGDVTEAGLDQRTAGPHLLVERRGIRLDRGVGDQPGLQITSPRTERRDAPDEPVQRQPVQPRLQFDGHGSSLLIRARIGSQPSSQFMFLAKTIASSEALPSW